MSPSELSPRPATRLVCAGCGQSPEPDDPAPFRCRHAGTGDVDHVLRRQLDPSGISESAAIFADTEPNPFLRYRRLLHSWQTASRRGQADAEAIRAIEALDTGIAAVPDEGRGFRETPFAPAPELARRLDLDPSSLWVKDETGNVAGSHKARHLMGLMLWLQMARIDGKASPAPLAIASCGNAALAASVVAAAAGRRLRVFVPPHAAGAIVERMTRLGAEIVPCPRAPGVRGDPCFHRLLEAIGRGAVPFTCQGSTNGLTIEGGQTLAWEIVSALGRTTGRLDRLFVQVGGGALATACLRGLEEARALGVLAHMPRVHAVQTAGAHPLILAWRRLAAHLGAPPALPDRDQAAFLRDLPEERLAAGFRFAAHHRSAFMEPWPTEPRSIATGILDDETYDWLAVVEGMVRTGGWPIAVDEPTLREANDLGRETTGIPVDPTGSAGLAGLIALRRAGEAFAGERLAVLFTGVERSRTSFA